MLVGDLILALQQYPKNLRVAINEQHNEATGMVGTVELIEGEENCPYDKGDNVYRSHGINSSASIVFIHSI